MFPGEEIRVPFLLNVQQSAKSIKVHFTEPNVTETNLSRLELMADGMRK